MNKCRRRWLLAETFIKIADNLEMNVPGQTDTLIATDGYTGSAKQTQEFRLNDGSEVFVAEVQSLLASMAAFGAPDSMMTTGTVVPQARTMQVPRVAEFFAVQP